jgi:peroxiredoxin
MRIDMKGSDMLHPAQPVPVLRVETLSHGDFDLSRDTGENGTLLIFYRGLHCPICIRQMTELDGTLDRFDEMGVSVIMVSGDAEARARETAEKAGVTRLRVAYGFDLVAARDDWGLHISKARPDTQEAPFFTEPATFYIAPDGTLYFGWIQTSPFARPQLNDIAGAIRFRLDRDYPPRGGYTGRLPVEG